MYFLTILSILLILISYVNCFISYDQCKLNYEKREIIEFNVSNLILIDGPIDESSSEKFANKIFSISSDKIYIYISSPGGDVYSAFKMINVIKTLSKNKEIVCIGEFAASAAFLILSQCDNKIVTNTSTLMQHQMATGTYGEIEKMFSKMKYNDKLNEYLITLQSHLFNMSNEEFIDKIRDEWWIFGREILDFTDKYNIFSDLVCSKDWQSKRVSTLIYFLKSYVEF